MFEAARRQIKDYTAQRDSYQQRFIYNSKALYHHIKYGINKQMSTDQKNVIAVQNMILVWLEKKHDPRIFFIPNDTFCVFNVGQRYSSARRRWRSYPLM